MGKCDNNYNAMHNTGDYVLTVSAPGGGGGVGPGPLVLHHELGAATGSLEVTLGEAPRQWRTRPKTEHVILLRGHGQIQTH